MVSIAREEVPIVDSTVYQCVAVWSTVKTDRSGLMRLMNVLRKSFGRTKVLRKIALFDFLYNEVFACAEGGGIQNSPNPKGSSKLTSEVGS
jgi:hypothetical protein